MLISYAVTSDIFSEFVIRLTQVCVQTLVYHFYGILVSYMHCNISACDFFLYSHLFVKDDNGTSW
jgi:hypothetical protein